MSDFSFSTAGINIDQFRDVLPAGTYVARIIESETKPLKSGNGVGLSLTFEVIDGPCAKRRVCSNMNVVHNNPEAQKIAQQQLAQICIAAGLQGGFEDTRELHNRPLKIRVKIRKDEQYGDKNEVSGAEAITGAVPSIPQEAMASAQRPATPSAPWAR